MPDDLYDRDILIWSEQQADLLRRLAAGERVNEAVDWPNVVEELQDVGRSEFRACRNLLQQAVTHLLKLGAFPEGSLGHWRGEAVQLLIQARDAYTPSMRQRFELERPYGDAREVIAAEDRRRAGQLPETCPYALDELLADHPDIDALLAKLG